MFGWILIAFIIALIFGVIKTEQIKDLWAKLKPVLQDIFAKRQDSYNHPDEQLSSSDTDEEKQ